MATDDLPKDRDNFKLLQHLAVLTLRYVVRSIQRGMTNCYRQMASGSLEERERVYLKGAISLLQSPCPETDVVPRLVLQQAFISTVQGSPAATKLEGDGLDLDGLRDGLLQVASPAITSGKRQGKGLLALLVALEALDGVDEEVVRKAFSSAVPSLLEASDSLLENGVQAGWQVRMFVANHFSEALVAPLKVRMSAEPQAAAEEDEGAADGSSAASLGKTALLRYVDAVVQTADENTKLGYLDELLSEDLDGQDGPGRLLVIYRLIQHLKGKRFQPPPDR